MTADCSLKTEVLQIIGGSERDLNTLYASNKVLLLLLLF